MQDDAIILSQHQIEAEWYSALIEECKAIITEAVFTSRWALVEGYHHLGKRILEDEPKMKSGGTTLREALQDLAKHLSISERTLYYAVKFVQKYPELDKVPEGKNITWNKIITKYLPAPKENKIDIDPPEGLYNVIVIDPPWPIEKIQRDCRPNQIDVDYQTMSLDEIVALHLPAMNDCHIWLWTTHRFLPEALRIFEAWSVNYVCAFVWHKPGGFQVVGLPQFNCEFAIYGRLGSPEFSTTKGLCTCFSAPRGKHSEKPDAFYEMVRNSTLGRRLDMFSRRNIQGFDAWGKEAPLK